jgi:hypothetical protein
VRVLTSFLPCPACFTGTKSANTCPACFTGTKSASTDELLAQLDLDFNQTAAQGASQRAAFETGSQFACFTGTKAQKLTLRLRQILSVLALLVHKWQY